MFPMLTGPLLLCSLCETIWEHSLTYLSQLFYYIMGLEIENRHKPGPLLLKPSKKEYASDKEMRVHHPTYTKRYSIAKGPWGHSDVYFQPGKGDVCIYFIQRGIKVTERLQAQILRHIELAHPFISNVLEVFALSSYLAVVKEYVNSWCLLFYVTKKKPGSLPEQEARRYFQQIAIALDYLHSREIPHKDLKLENCIMCYTSERKAVIKLTGFEMAKHERVRRDSTSSYLAYEYQAPELWGKQTADSYDGKAADMWSLGVMLYRLVFGEYPFPRPPGTIDYETEAPDLLQRELPENAAISDNCRDVIEGLLKFDKTERMTIKDVQEHSWFLKDMPAKALTLNDRMGRQENLTEYYTARQSREEVKQLLREATTASEPEILPQKQKLHEFTTMDDHQLQEMNHEESRDHCRIMQCRYREWQERKANSHTGVRA